MNWGIMSQKHAVSLGHVDTAGVYTAIAILSGAKYWAVRKTALDGNQEMGPDDIRYWERLEQRDLKSLPGGESAWVPLLLLPGDIL